MSNPRPTLADIAREAGVSLMTVSRVVNQKDGVGSEQRQRIETLIKQMGYRPSGIARSLVTQRTGTIGLVVPDIANPFFPDIARGVEQIAFQHGYSLLLCNTEENPSRELDVLDLLLEKQVDGVILCSSRLPSEKLKEILPAFAAVVLVNRMPEDEDMAGADAVLVDDFRGGQMLGQHLQIRGHSQVAFLAGPEQSFSGKARFAGLRNVLGADVVFLTCEPTVGGGQRVAREILGARPDLTALCAFNDLVAVGALQAAAEVGRQVPADLVVTGYDDIQLAGLVTPALTTCRVQRENLGCRAAELLLDRLDRSDGQFKTIKLTPQLIQRASAP